MEIVSDRSVTKDTRRLPAAYHRAGVREFWLVDARGEELSFQIFHAAASAYEAVGADRDGFLASLVFGRRFRLARRRNPHGRWIFDLEVASEAVRPSHE